MEIIFHKGADGPDRLICHRRDGSMCQESLSPYSAYHDIAHYVVEKELGIQDGIWGKLAQGHTMAEYNLPNEERPFQLTAEAYRAEFLATLVQSAVPTGTLDTQYVEMVQQMCLTSGLPFPELPSPEIMGQLIQQTQTLIRQWESLGGGEKLTLAWTMD
jgi:hypothetical protein